jgi:hypothetical protein
LSFPLGPFQIFWEIADIFSTQGAPPVLLTLVAKRKNLQSEKLNFLVWTPLGSKVNK